MEKLRIQNNWVWLVSFLPGIGILLLGKQLIGASIFLVTCFLIGIFLVFPNMLTWFLFGIVFIAQMAYAIGLSTVQQKNNSEGYSKPNSNNDLAENNIGKSRTEDTLLSDFVSLYKDDFRPGALAVYAIGTAIFFWGAFYQ